MNETKPTTLLRRLLGSRRSANSPVSLNKRIGHALTGAIAAGVLLLTAGTAQAVYPEQPINMIVAYAPGGGTDIVARALARHMEKHLGNGARIVVQNKTGAGGAIGFGILASAPADGYTIGFINTPNVLTIPIERKVPFTWQSFDLLGNIVDDPGNFSVHSDSPIKSLSDLAAYAKANPGAATVGSTGVGSDDHLAMLLFEKATGVKMTHVPYKGSSDVHGALGGHQIVVGAINIGEALQASKGGIPIRNLGQMSVSRSALAPNVPTFREQGYDIVMASLRGVAAPKGLPAPIREQLVKAVAAAAADPEFQTQAAGLFAPLRYLAPAPYEAELRAGEAQFRQLWTEVPWGEK